MPRSLSKEAGRNAVTERGAFSAQSGIQLCTGITPALAKDAIIRHRKATRERPPEIGILTSSIAKVLVKNQIIPIPKIIKLSEPPTMIKAFFAAAPASTSPIPISRYKVNPRNPQNITRRIRLLASTAPQAAAIVQRI